MFSGLDKYWETMNGILWPRLTQVNFKNFYSFTVNKLNL